MFEDSLVESAGRIKTHQSWTTPLSFLVQAVVICILVLIPLIFTEGLPTRMLIAAVVAPPPPPPPPPPPAPTVRVQRVSEIVNGELRAPSKIPKKIEMIKEDEAPPPSNGIVGGVVGGVPGGTAGGVIGGLIQSTAPPPTVAKPQKLRISSGVAEGLLKTKVDPQYPQMAKIAHVQGDVILQATISKNGAIENLRAISGHPILIQAAMDAVRQWRYAPYTLNGEPVEIETTITVKFHI